MNKITLIGNLTKDPETRSTQSGITICSFTIAVNRRFANSDGDRQTEFFRINAWRQLGETCARYLSKGRKVAVLGELQARTYEAKDGSTRMSLDVAADEVEFLSPADSEQNRFAKAAEKGKETITPQELFSDLSNMKMPWDE